MVLLLNGVNFGLAEHSKEKLPSYGPVGLMMLMVFNGFQMFALASGDARRTDSY